METANRLRHISEYYFSKKLREVRQLKASGKPIINLGIGSPDLAPPSQVISALNESLTHPNAHKYQSYQGLPELRKAMADFYKTYFDVHLNPENQILPLMGSKEGILPISMAFLNEGDEVLIPNPGYPTYQAVTKLVGASPVFYDLKDENGWLLNVESLEKNLSKKVKLMWINYPNMPTGAKANAAFFEKLVDFAQRHNILIINDNPYSFVLNENPLSLLKTKGALDNCLELNSLSKTFNMAGWRVGMVLGNEKNLKAILNVKSNMDSGMFYGVQKGAIAALQSSPEWFENLNETFKKRRERVLELAQKLGCEPAENAAGMFVWAKLRGAVSSEDFINKVLSDYDLFIAPGHIFGSNGEGYVRFSLCVSTEQIEEAISRLK